MDARGDGGGSRAWYEEAFGDDYRRVYAHRDLESARGEAAFLIAQGVRGRVLDLCCGFGRHALLLAEAGLEVCGLDLSMDLLRAAERLPGFASLLAGRLLRADMADLPFVDDSFDSLVNLFSSFGYLGEAGDARVLRGAARVLRPGGLAVFDLMNPVRVRAQLVPSSRRSGDGFVLDERRRLEEGGRRVVKEVELHLSGGQTRRWREDVRLYEAHELTELLAEAGLAVELEFGDFDGSALTSRSPRRIVLARPRRS